MVPTSAALCAVSSPTISSFFVAGITTETSAKTMMLADSEQKVDRVHMSVASGNQTSGSLVGISKGRIRSTNHTSAPAHRPAMNPDWVARGINNSAMVPGNS